MSWWDYFIFRLGEQLKGSSSYSWHMRHAFMHSCTPSSPRLQHFFFVRISAAYIYSFSISTRLLFFVLSLEVWRLWLMGLLFTHQRLFCTCLVCECFHLKTLLQKYILFMKFSKAFIYHSISKCFHDSPTPCFDYLGNFGDDIICVWTTHNWPRNVHLRASKMRLCSLTLEILYACLKNSKWAICSVHLKVTGWFKTDATCEALLNFLSNLSKFICAQLHFVTAQLTILHNYNIFHAQTELIAGSKKKEIFLHRIPNRANTKTLCARIFCVWHRVNVRVVKGLL